MLSKKRRKKLNFLILKLLRKTKAQQDQSNKGATGQEDKKSKEEEFTRWMKNLFNAFKKDKKK